jgi:hypothetical protein
MKFLFLELCYQPAANAYDVRQGAEYTPVCGKSESCQTTVRGDASAHIWNRHGFPAFLSMRALPFHHVTIMTEPAGRILNVASVEEAAEFLLQHWPDEWGRKYQTARQTCLEALAGREATRHARSAFIAAAKEADIYVKERTPTPANP